MLFSNIFGNKRILDVLRRDIKEDKISHAYLLAGAPYIGKYQILSELASILQCENNNHCGHCKSCVLISKKSHPDIMVIEDLPIEKNEDKILKRTNLPLETRKTDTITIKDVKLVQNRLFKTTDSKYSIVIISDIERMNKEAANSLLKIIEEPPSKRTLFLFSTKDISRVTETTVSRCKNLELHIPSKEETMAFLKTQDFEITDLDRLLKFIPNSPGYLFKIAKNPEKLEKIKERVSNLETAIEGTDMYAIMQYASGITSAKEANKIFEHLEIYIEWLFKKINKNYNKIIELEKILEIINDAKKYVSANVSLKLTMEQCLLQIHSIIQKII